MKKFISTLLAICTFVSVSAAQYELGLGVKFGLNFASIGGDVDAKTLTNYLIGITGDINLSDDTGISAELVLSQQGCKTTSGDYSEKTKLSYLNIPILFNFYAMESLAIKAGIQPGIRFTAKDGNGNKIKDTYRVFDFAIPIGVSYDVTENVYFDARYNIGVANILQDNNDSAHNGVFQLSVGYKF